MGEIEKEKSFGKIKRTALLGHPATAVAYRYDSQGRLTKITRRLDGEIIDKDVHGYNSDGLIASIDRLNTSDSRRYGYDTQGRITHEAHGDGTVNNMATVDYNYDAVGNRLMRTVDGQTKLYSYAPNANQLQSIGQQDLSYDVRGNLIGDRSGSRSFGYDVTNRMDAFYSDGELRAEYDHDVKGAVFESAFIAPMARVLKVSGSYTIQMDGS